MAARYWVGTGDGNWGSTNNWSDTSGGATGFSIPTASDDVTFDGGGNNPCTINTSARVCLSLTVTSGYTSTITHNQQLTVSGNITLHNGYTISGTSSNILSINATCTFTSGGLVIPLQVTIGAAITVTLADDLYISGRLNSGNNTCNYDGFKIYLSGSLSNSFPIQGTSTIVLLTGSTWSSGIFVRNAISIEGDCTISSAVKSGGSITYVSGSPTITGLLTIFPSVTMNTSGISWNNVTISTNIGTVTVSSAWSINGLLTIATTETINGSNVTVGNGIAINGSTTGTAKIILTGGTWSGSNTTGIANDLDLQGNVTVSGNVYYRTGTLTYVSGTITVTSSTLNITAGCSLDTNGMGWNNLTFSITTATHSLISNLLVNGILTANGVTNTINASSGQTLTVGNGFRFLANQNARFTGSAKIIWTGGTWVVTAGFNTNQIVNSLDIQGDVTVSGTVYYIGGVMTYVSGVVTTTSSTLVLMGSCTLNTNGVTWNNITTVSTTGQTYTINSLLSISSTLTLGIAAAQTFAGTAGFSVSILSCAATSAQTVSFKESVTYTITSSFDCNQSRIGSIILFASSHGSIRANILMPNNGSNLCNVLASFTRIDASGGRSINTFGGTITDCININQYYDYKGVAA